MPQADEGFSSPDSTPSALERDATFLHNGLARAASILGMRECIWEEMGMSADPNSAAPRRVVEFEDATPILRVASFEASVEYYTTALGFTLAWQAGRFGCVRRGGAALMLSEGSQGCARTWVYLAVSDADALFDECRERGATIRQQPTNYPWGSRELHVFDPDGHVLRFGSDAQPGEPFGVWVDEQGVRWLPQPDGSWSREE